MPSRKRRDATAPDAAPAASAADASPPLLIAAGERPLTCQQAILLGKVQDQAPEPGAAQAGGTRSPA